MWEVIEGDTDRLAQSATESLCSAMSTWGESQEMADVHSFGC